MARGMTACQEVDISKVLLVGAVFYQQMADNSSRRVNRCWPKAQITCQYHGTLFNGIGVSTQIFSVCKYHNLGR